MNKKLYLGDSVYMSYDGFHVVLTTENGYEASNTIKLEPYLIPKISEYLEHLKSTVNHDE